MAMCYSVSGLSLYSKGQKGLNEKAEGPCDVVFGREEKFSSTKKDENKH